MRFSVVFQGWVVTSEGGLPVQDEITTHLDGVRRELDRLGAKSAQVVSNAADGSVEISVAIDADDWDKAQDWGSNVIRTAIHAAGGATPGWSIDWCRVTIQKDQLTAA